MNELKEYGIKYKELKAVCVELNASELASITVKVSVGTKGGDMLCEFLNAIESVADKKVKEIPENVGAFYDNLSDDVFDDVPPPEEKIEKKAAAPSKAKAKAKAKEKNKERSIKNKKEQKRATKSLEKASEKADGVKSDCPGFGETYEKKEANCKDCKKSFPKEHDSCKELCEAKSKEKKAKKTAKRNTTPGKKTRYGHSLNTMTGVIDDLLWEGNTRENIAKAVAERFERTPAKANSCLRGHLKRMVRLGVVTLEERDDDVLKAENEYADGFTKDNTEAA